MRQQTTSFKRLANEAKATKEEKIAIIDQVDFYLRFAKAPAKLKDIDSEIEITHNALNAVRSVKAQSERSFSNNDRWTKIEKKIKTRFTKLLTRRDVK